MISGKDQDIICSGSDDLTELFSNCVCSSLIPIIIISPLFCSPDLDPSWMKCIEVIRTGDVPMQETELNCVNTAILYIPELMQLLIGISIRRYCPAIGTAGFASIVVRGKRRVPLPPPRITANTSSKGNIIILLKYTVMRSIGSVIRNLKKFFSKERKFIVIYFTLQKKTTQ
jgi:hypothetical protein